MGTIYPILIHIGRAGYLGIPYSKESFLDPLQIPRSLFNMGTRCIARGRLLSTLHPMLRVCPKHRISTVLSQIMISPPLFLVPFKHFMLTKPWFLSHDPCPCFHLYCSWFPWHSPRNNMCLFHFETSLHTRNLPTTFTVLEYPASTPVVPVTGHWFS